MAKVLQQAAHAAIAMAIGASAAMAQSVEFNNPLLSPSDNPNRPFFRAPVLVQAADGALILFAEAREKIDDPGRGDGLSDIVMKKSTDGGQTWSSLRTLYAGASNDYTQPTVVLDQSTGHLHLHFEETPNLFISNGTFVSKGHGSNTFHHYVMTSTDNGETWSSAQAITAQVKDANWDVFALGPTTGVQLKWQTNASLNGRLVIPAFRSDGLTAANLAVYSDNQGATWQRGAVAGGAQTNEVDLVELTNGNLLMNARADNGGPRYQYLSSDGGATWHSATPVDLPVTPIDTNLIRYSAVRDGDDRDRLLLSAPLGDPMGSSSGTNYNDRYNIGVWTSYDEGKTYINPRRVANGWGGYSAMQRLPDGRIGMVYESNFSYDDARMHYARFDLAFLEGQEHKPALTHYDGFGNTIDRLRGGMGWSGSWTGNPTVVGNGQLTFDGFKFATERGRVDLVNGQSIERELATPIDMSSEGVTYFSVLISQRFDTSPNAGNDFLSIALIDSTDAMQVGFGVGSGEEFHVGGLGDGDGTAQGAMNRNSTYFLVAKLVTQDSSGFDQIFLKVFESGVDSIPDTDDLMEWTAIGGTQSDRDALINRIRITSGTEVRWSLDEFRIGTTFGSVASNLNPVYVPEPGAAGLAVFAAGAMILRSRQNRQPGN